MSVNTTQLIAKAVENLPQTESRQVKQQTTAVVIRFTNPGYIDDTKEALTTLFPELGRYENLLIGFYRNHTAALTATNSIGRVLDKYNHDLIVNTFEQNWLAEYFKRKNHGVEIVMVAYNLNKPSEIPTYLKDTTINKAKMESFHGKREAAKLACMSYTGESFINDCTQFAFANWDGFSTKAEAVKLFTGMYEILECETRGKCHFGRYPAQKTLLAIKDKAKALFKANATKQAEDNDKLFSQMSYEANIEEKFNRLTESNNQHVLWDHCRKLLSKHLKTNAKDIMPKGLLLLLENSEELEDEELEEATVEEPIFSPFIDLSFTMDGCISNRISPKKLRHDIQEQGGDLLDLIAGAVAAYYLQIMEFKQDIKFENLLHEHSKVMDEKPFYDHWLELAKESQPNP